MRSLAANLKENVEIAARSIIKLFNVRRNRTTMVGIAETRLYKIFACFVLSQDMSRKDCFKLKEKESQDNNYHASNNYGNRDNQVSDSQDMAFTVIAESQKLTNNVWICDSGACCHYCNNKDGFYNIKEISKDIVV
jgi:hypothetical protein